MLFYHLLNCALQALQERLDTLEAERHRQRGGCFEEDNAMQVKQESRGPVAHLNGIDGNVLLPAMSSSGLHHCHAQATPCHPSQVGLILTGPIIILIRKPLPSNHICDKIVPC